jgi:hypothetical protein
MPAYRKQVEAFRRKFGREMAPEDPFFFDPKADHPQFRPPDDLQQALDVLAELLAGVGVAPEKIFAFKRTGGLLPTEGTKLSRQERRDWDAAIKEYHSLLQRTREQ